MAEEEPSEHVGQDDSVILAICTLPVVVYKTGLLHLLGDHHGPSSVRFPASGSLIDKTSKGNPLDSNHTATALSPRCAARDPSYKPQPRRNHATAKMPKKDFINEGFSCEGESPAERKASERRDSLKGVLQTGTYTSSGDAKNLTATQRDDFKKEISSLELFISDNA